MRSEQDEAELLWLTGLFAGYACLVAVTAPSGESVGMALLVSAYFGLVLRARWERRR